MIALALATATMSPDRQVITISPTELIFTAVVGIALTALLHAEQNGLIERLGRVNPNMQRILERLLYALAYMLLMVLLQMAPQLAAIIGG